MENANYTLIPGASGGIGKELAEICAVNGQKLILCARNIERLEEIKKELEEKYKAQVFIIKSDLAQANSASLLFKEIKSKGLSVNILINNAGFGDFGFFEKCDLKIQLEMIQLNITSLTELTRLILPNMVEQKYGRIMNVASVAAFQPGPLMSVYFATKAFVLHFSEAIANELKGTGVTVTTLCPGPTKTNFDKAANVTNTALFSGKLPGPKEVAEFGFKKMMKGKIVAIHGFKNKVLVFAGKITPRRLVVNMTRKMVDKK